jgi:hypothetical protein
LSSRCDEQHHADAGDQHTTRRRAIEMAEKEIDSMDPSPGLRIGMFTTRLDSDGERS